tara:strand:- start:121 stop:561 length:441 start_codon:yes stop_codon:yes gene_type:complete
MAVKAAQGAVLQIAGTTVGEVTNISLSMSRGSIETSAIDDAADSGKTYIPAGLYEGGEISFDLLYDSNDTEAKAVLDNLQDGATDGAITWKIRTPSSEATNSYDEWTFDGFVTGFDVTLALEDAVKASVTIKLTYNSSTDSFPTSD